LRRGRIALAGAKPRMSSRPIGAQRPQSRPARCRAISELVIEAHRAGRDVGAPDLLARYDRARRRCHQPDRRDRHVNRSLLSDFLPVAGRARGSGFI